MTKLLLVTIKLTHKNCKWIGHFIFLILLFKRIHKFIMEMPIIFTFLSDWACGGQWNRMVQFLAVLIQTVQTSHIELAVFFNGCLEQQRMAEWITSQQEVRKKINQVQIIYFGWCDEVFWKWLMGVLFTAL